ncbi:MAG: helix-turn-helix transcriptional regulator [Bdellovibrio sp.]
MSLSQSLRRVLDNRKMTVAHLSRLSGVPAKTIYHWLSGQQPRKMDHLFRICDILELTIEELYGRNPVKEDGQLPQSLSLQPLSASEFHAGIYEVILRPIKKNSAS